MWTHADPFEPFNLTPRSIRYHGALALYRALNVKRVIAFTGSGATMARGRLTWSELAATAVREGALIALAWHGDNKRELPYREAELVRQIFTLMEVSAPEQRLQAEVYQRLAQAAGVITIPGGATTALLEIIENLMERLEDSRDARLDAAKVGDVVESVFHDFTRSHAVSDAQKAADLAQLKAALTGKPGEPSLNDLALELRGTASERLPSILIQRLQEIGLGSEAWLGAVVQAAADYSASSSRRDELPKLTLRRRLAEIASARGSEIARARLEAGMGRTLDPVLGRENEQIGLVGDILAAPPPPEADVIGALRRGLKINRFMTLNYDVEIERSVYERLDGLGPDEDAAFRHLCENPTRPFPRPRHDGDAEDEKRGRVRFETGTRRAIMSETLGEDTIGDLMNFAAYPRAWDAQVFHLHGRVDRPESMVITQQDYLSLYARDESGRRAFEEAREALFGGNDILFVGVGMNEDDVLRPLRQFAARARSRGREQRRIFALLPRPSGASSEADLASRAVHLYTSYGVSALYFGAPEFSDHVSNLRELSKALDALLLASDLKLALNLKGSREEYDPLDQLSPDEMEKRRAILKILAEAIPANIGDLWNKVAYSILMFPPMFKYVGKVYALFEKVVRNAKQRKRAIEDALISKDVGKNALETNGIWSRDDKTWSDLICARTLLNYAIAQEQSKALVSEIQAIERRGARWWKDWRERPKARRASFPFVSSALVNRASYVMTRHRTDFFWQSGAPDFDKINASAPLRAMREQALSRYRWKIEPPGRRIIRIGLDRGGGHGVLTHLLQYPEIHTTIFPDAAQRDSDKNLPHQAYSGAFFASVGFSPEFSSAIGALTRFIAGHVALCEIELAKTDTEHFKRIRRGLPDGATDQSELAKSFSDFSESYAATRREAPILAIEEHLDIRDRHGLPTEPRRRHRLDVFRGVLKRWEDLAHRLPHKRLLVCLSGLDRICNSDGDAWSPMHRAFFRMLTASDQKTPNINIHAVPLDLILISGDPETPIAYLSKVDDQPDRRSTEVSRASAIGHALVKWRRLPRFDFRDRADFAPVPIDRSVAIDGAPNRGLSDLLISWAERLSPWEHSERHRVLRRFCHENLAADMWLRVLLQKLETGGAKGGADLTWLNAKLDEADAAVSEDRGDGLIRFILSEYRIHDAKRDDHCLQRTLTDLIMKHLSMFWLPVELRSLAACPEIAHELDRLARVAAPPPVDDWERREKTLLLLRDHLEELKARGLVIRILSQNETAGDLDAVKKPGKKEIENKNTDRVIHARYSIHGQLRRYFSNLMRLHATDRGDSNHFQVSIFGDQPNDLPTPSSAHFAMVSRILERQIDDARNLLWSAYQFRPKAVGKLTNEDETGREYAAQAIVGRLYGPPSHANSLVGRLGAFHSVPQRARASLGLIRVAFSLGAISRIDYDRLQTGGEPAFELYRSWIRALLNIAVGLNQNAPLFAAIGRNELAQFSKKMIGPAREENDRQQAGDFHKATEKAGHALKWELQQSFVTKIRQPFYRDEIAWLYNERGLVSFVQGKINDALPLLNRARFHILHQITPEFDNHAFRANERRILLNIALAKIERGKIGEGRADLQELQRSSASVEHSTPSATSPIALGFLGLCDHLSGALERAIETYRSTIDAFNARQRLRPVSVFNRLLADALIYSRQFEEALHRADFALNAASNAEQRDVLHEAYLTKAGALWRLGDTNRALALIDRSDDYAQAMGLHRLEASALLRRSDIMLSQGEVGLAGESAARAVGLASRHGMGLRKISGLVAYGGVLLRRGDDAVAYSILREAQRESERIGYQTAAARAADLIAELDAQRRPSPDAASSSRYAGPI